MKFDYSKYRLHLPEFVLLDYLRVGYDPFGLVKAALRRHVRLLDERQ